MKISIRKSKHQENKITTGQIKFAFDCITKYIELDNRTRWSYEIISDGKLVNCDIYKTITTKSTTISAILKFIK